MLKIIMAITVVILNIVAIFFALNDKPITALATEVLADSTALIYACTP